MRADNWLLPAVPAIVVGPMRTSSATVRVDPAVSADPRQLRSGPAKHASTWMQSPGRASQRPRSVPPAASTV